MLLIEPVEFFRVEHRAAAADAVEGEDRYQLLARKNFLVGARRPSKQREEVDHGFGHDALPLVLGHRRRAMTLAQALAIGTEDQRHVRELRHRSINRPVEKNLLRRVRNVVVPAYHVRDLHLHIVGHDGELVGGMAV